MPARASPADAASWSRSSRAACCSSRRTTRPRCTRSARSTTASDLPPSGGTTSSRICAPPASGWPTCAGSPTTGKDVTGRWLANAYAQTIGSIFSEHQKPFEVEICVAEVGPPRPPRPTAGGSTGDSPAGDGGPGTGDQLYRISYDGSIVEERKFVVMGGVNEPVITALNASFTGRMGPGDRTAVRGQRPRIDRGQPAPRPAADPARGCRAGSLRAGANVPPDSGPAAGHPVDRAQPFGDRRRVGAGAGSDGARR